MTKLTTLEEKVLDAVKADCLLDFSSSVKEVSTSTGLNIDTVKGVVGSLVAKGRIETEQEERGGTKYYDLFFISEAGETLSFGEYS